MKKHICGIGLLILIIALSSCEESFLERKLYGVLDQDTYYGTDNSGFKIVASCYQPMHDGFAYSINKVAIGSEITDDADGGGSNAGDRPQTTEVGMGYPLTSNALLFETWTNRYKGIGRCNVGIEQLSKEDLTLKEGSQPVPKETILRYLSEMKFLRAWYYFDLVNTFGSVPIVLSILPPSEKVEKASIEEMRTMLYKDIDDAINDSNLPWKKNMDNTTELGRVSKDAAYSFKARMALFFAGLMEQNKIQGSAAEEYTIAKDAAFLVISNGGLSLTPDFQDLFGGDYKKGLSSSECIFTCLSKYIASVYSGDAFTIMNVGRNNVGGWGGNVPTTDLAKSYDIKDPRKLFTIIYDRDSFIKGTGSEVHNYKGYFNFHLQHSRKAFVPWDYRVGGSLTRSEWAPYWIRYAEVLLMYAEATLKTGGSNDEVVTYINMVRNRAYVTTSKKDAFAVSRLFEEDLEQIDEATFTSLYAVKPSDDLMAAIKLERRNELAMEGLRLYDLIRWGDYVTTMQTYFQKYNYSGKGSLASDKSWPFPIPQVEIDRSDGTLLQNANYN